MTGLERLDHLAVANAVRLHDQLHAIVNSIARLDIDSAVDRLLMINGYGNLIGLPSMPGTSSTATTGVPTNGIAGFAKGALFINYRGSAGSLLYVNTGSNTSATWTNLI